MIGKLGKMRGLAQIPLMIGLLIMAVAIPAVTKLVQQSQDTRSSAASSCSTFCSGNNIMELCAGSSPTVKQTCSSGCSNGACTTCNGCEGTSNGSIVCASSTSIKMCNCNTWSATTNCAPGLTCSGGQCSAPAPAPTCTTFCSGNNKMQTCGNAQPTLIETCSSGCSNGACTTCNGCEGTSNGSIVCASSTSIKMCNCNTWSATTNCAPGLTCSGGQCSAPPTCSSFTYSAWGTCNNGTQTRTVTSSSPSGCTGGSPVISQTCCYDFCDGNNSIRSSCDPQTVKSTCPGGCSAGKCATCTGCSSVYGTKTAGTLLCLDSNTVGICKCDGTWEKAACATGLTCPGGKSACETPPACTDFCDSSGNVRSSCNPQTVKKSCGNGCSNGVCATCLTCSGKAVGALSCLDSNTVGVCKCDGTWEKAACATGLTCPTGGSSCVAYTKPTIIDYKLSSSGRTITGSAKCAECNHMAAVTSDGVQIAMPGTAAGGFTLTYTAPSDGTYTITMRGCSIATGAGTGFNNTCPDAALRTQDVSVNVASPVTCTSQGGTCMNPNECVSTSYGGSVIGSYDCPSPPSSLCCTKTVSSDVCKNPGAGNLGKCTNGAVCGSETCYCFDGDLPNETNIGNLSTRTCKIATSRADSLCHNLNKCSDGTVCGQKNLAGDKQCNCAGVIYSSGRTCSLDLISTVTTCTSQGGSCMNPNECVSASYGGSVIGPYDCPSPPSSMCCKKNSVPTVSLCNQCKANAGANNGNILCKSKTNGLDISTWISEFDFSTPVKDTWRADVNCDGKVMADDLSLIISKFSF